MSILKYTLEQIIHTHESNFKRYKGSYGEKVSFPLPSSNPSVSLSEGNNYC